MSEIDAKTFKPTKEEEAILDACFRGNIQCLGVAIVNYGRALFAPAASKTESTDPDCNPHDHSWSYGYCHTCHLMGRPQPASEPKKVCENCGGVVEWGAPHRWKHPNGPDTFDCQSAPPEPAAPVGKCPHCHERVGMEHRTIDGAMEHFSCELPKPEPAAPVGEMPEAVRLASLALHRAAGFYACEAQPTASIMRIVEAADALESWWRTHAQPVSNVAMTEELERILNYAEGAARFNTWSPPDSKLMVADCAAVRAQATAPKKLEKVPVREIGRAASALRLWKTQTDADVFGAKEDADEIDRWLKRLDAFERGGREGE